MFCKNCGKEIKQENKFCNNCGYEIKDNKAIINECNIMEDADRVIKTQSKTAKTEKMKNLIITIIIVVFIVIYLIFIFFQVEALKQQNIAYEQYIQEDLKQARLYNYTFIDNEEDFKAKIKNLAESDKKIAEYLYEIKPKVEDIKSKYIEEQKIKKEKEDKINELNTEKTTNTDELEKLKEELATIEYDNIKESEAKITLIGFDIKELESKLITINVDIERLEKELATNNNNILDLEKQLEEINENGNKFIKDNSNNLRYQEKIETDGIKTAIDYITTLPYIK